MRSPSDLMAIGVALLLAAALSYAAYLIAGWIGVAALGLLTAFIAVRLDIERDAPVGGPQSTELHALGLRGREQMSRAERAGELSEIRSNLRAGSVAKLIGIALTLVGLGGFFLVQL